MNVTTQRSAPASGLTCPLHWLSLNFWTVARQVSHPGNPGDGLMSVYLDRGVIPYSEGGGLVHKPSESLDAYQLVEPGHFVLNNQQAWRGSVGVSRYRGIVSPAYLIFELSDRLNPIFANYQFRDRRFVDEMMLSSQGVGDIQRQVKWPLLRYAKVFVPCIEEQDTIVSYLDRATTRIDALVAKKTRFIELLREKRQALITHAVTKGLDASVPMKESGMEWVGAIPSHWEVRPFYSFATEVDSPNTGLKERNLLSLSYGQLVRKDMDRLEGLTPASFEGYNIIEPNDIVFRLTDLQNDQRSLRSARAQERGIITSAYITVRPKASPRFFEYLMRSYDTSKVFYGIGGGIRQSMKFADLKRLPVVVPPISEMDAIASHLDRATTRIDMDLVNFLDSFDF